MMSALGRTASAAITQTSRRNYRATTLVARWMREEEHIQHMELEKEVHERHEKEALDAAKKIADSVLKLTANKDAPTIEPVLKLGKRARKPARRFVSA